MIVPVIMVIKKYVGNAKKLPASLTPRKFTYMRISTTATVMTTVYGTNEGTALVNAAVPALH